MRASRRRAAALAAVLLLGLAGSAHGVTARTRTFQSRFRTEQGKEWQVHVDHDSGRPYFFDKETGTSTWDDPRTTPDGDSGAGASSRSGGLLGSLFEPGEVKFTGGGLGGKSRRSSKRAAREAEETRSWFGLFPSSRASSPLGASDDDYGELDADQRRSAGGWSESSLARRRRVGTGGAKRNAGHDENTGRMRLDDDDDDIRDGDDDAAKSTARSFSYARAPFARGAVAVTLVASATSVVVLCVAAVARVVDRAGKGGVGYSRRDATFLGETAREIRFAVAKSTRRKRARLESSFAFAQTVLMETFGSLAEMRLGRGAVAFAAGARKIEKSASIASLAQFCVLSHHLVESAERVAETLESASIDAYRGVGSEGGHRRAPSLDATGARLPWLALVSASLVTLALHGVAPRRCVALALAENAARGPTLGAAFDVCARAFSSRLTGEAPAFGVMTDAALALKRLACWACTGVVLSRLGRRERARVRRKVSTGALDGSAAASDDEDDEEDEDAEDEIGVAARDAVVSVSRARHRSPPAPTTKSFAKTQSRGASAALLAARGLLAATFLSAGAARVYEPAAFASHPSLFGDALVLVKLALAVPLAAGHRVGATTRAAAACLALEAFSRFGGSSAGRAKRPASARAHLAADVACAGGLVLLRAMGGRTRAPRRRNGSDATRLRRTVEEAFEKHAARLRIRRIPFGARVGACPRPTGSRSRAPTSAPRGDRASPSPCTSPCPTDSRSSVPTSALRGGRPSPRTCTSPCPTGSRSRAPT